MIEKTYEDKQKQRNPHPSNCKLISTQSKTTKMNRNFCKVFRRKKKCWCLFWVLNTDLEPSTSFVFNSNNDFTFKCTHCHVQIFFFIVISKFRSTSRKKRAKTQSKHHLWSIYHDNLAIHTIFTVVFFPPHDCTHNKKIISHANSVIYLESMFKTEIGLQTAISKSFNPKCHFYQKNWRRNHHEPLLSSLPVL